MNYSRILTTPLFCLFPALLSAQNPFGNLDTPANGSTNLAGAINVTGWALSVYTVSTLSIYRSPVPGESGLVYVQNAPFIAGSRPDVAYYYPNYPNNNWGFGTQLLTNELPDSNGDGGHGNGTYVLYAIAYDPYGRSATIGTATISVDNRDSPYPFGTIDTPAEGGTASGTAFVNFGWALTPQPNYIPFDGSTMQVVIDGLVVAQPAYNNYRSDIASLFPGLANSDSAIGYFIFNTGFWGNGLHTISWNVWDSAGHGTGIGSRYFSITGVQGVPSFNAATPESIALQPTATPNSACSDITGTWNENVGSAQWTLTQAAQGNGNCGYPVCGNAVASLPGCGNVNWPVYGSLTNTANGTFTLYGHNPSQSSCGVGNLPPTPSFTDTVTLSFPSCITGTGVHTDANQNSYNSTWTDPDPQIPTKLSMVVYPLNEYYAEPVIARCPGTFPQTTGDSGWGYSRCVTYTVLDQNTPAQPLKNTTKYSVKESAMVVNSTYQPILTTQQTPLNIGNDASVPDFLSLVNPDGPLPAGTKGVDKQIITITDTTTNHPYQVRVNCIVRSATDVTVIDVTTQGDQTCTSYY